MKNLKDSLAPRIPISTIAIVAFFAAVLVVMPVPVKGGYPTSGTGNVPVILINFPDRSTTYGTADFENLLLNSTSGSRSMWEYYNETSMGLSTLPAVRKGLWDGTPPAITMTITDLISPERQILPGRRW